LSGSSPAHRPNALGLRPGRLKAKIEDEELLLGGDIILAVQEVRIGDSDWRAQIRGQGPARTWRCHHPHRPPVRPTTRAALHVALVLQTRLLAQSSS
jgi:hypothetical protein